MIFYSVNGIFIPHKAKPIRYIMRISTALAAQVQKKIMTRYVKSSGKL